MQAIFYYSFMQKALLVGAILGLIMPCVGVTVVLKRFSMIGDALAHCSLAGVTIGLLCGFNPVLGASLACVFSALSIEGIRKHLPAYAELAIAILMSGGVGIAGLLSSRLSSGASINSFLFGSIVTISDAELYSVIVLSLLVLLVYLLLYKELFYLSLDEQSARLAGVPVKLVNTVFTVLTALTVALAARTVGSLIVSSVMVIPVACAMRVARSYRQTVLFSSLFGLLFVLAGLTLSYYRDLKPGATIVLIAVAVLTLLLLTGPKQRRA